MRYVAGNFNPNLLDYTINIKEKSFVNTTFEHGLIPMIINPIRITSSSAPAINHIIINSLLDSKVETSIIPTDI